jgi:hypothetical protein
LRSDAKKTFRCIVAENSVSMNRNLEHELKEISTTYALKIQSSHKKHVLCKKMDSEISINSN